MSSFHFTRVKNLILIALSLLFCEKVFAQDNQDSTLLKVANGITQESLHFSREKIYVQTDKPDYNTGDTLWFKTYLFNASYLKPSPKSGILYIEIADENNQVIKRMLVSPIDGLGWGDIPLSAKLFPAGNYTLRAYTNWMRNFSEGDVFRKQFSIHDYTKQDLLVNARFTLIPFEGDKGVHATIQLQRMNGLPVSFRTFQVALINGNKVLHKNNLLADVNGEMTFDFKTPKGVYPDKLSILLMGPAKETAASEMTIPVILSDNEDIDLQFQPEGGKLIAGVRNLVGFKAIHSNGMGVDISGIIYNNKNQKVTDFKSSHLGMGSFYFIPQPGESYTAVIPLHDGLTKSYSLPVVQNAGIVLHVSDSFNSDSVEIDIMATPDLQNKSNLYYLEGCSRGIGCFAARLTLDKGTKTYMLDKNIFPTGIARFTLLNEDMQPLCQRIIFVDNHDQLQAHFTYKSEYAIRDSAIIKLNVSDSKGSPVQGDFSVAVTNDALVNIDTMKYNSLVSDIYLTSDLKGNIEDPGYYFPSKMTEKIWNDLNDLLLTQGWVSYAWKAKDESGSPAYPAEQSFSIAGKVTNIFNKPVNQSEVLLFSEKPLSIQQTTTNKAGEFSFAHLFPVDTASYLIQARNRHGKSFNVGIQLNEFKPPVFNLSGQSVVPWYVNIDTGHLTKVKSQMAEDERAGKIRGKHVLQEVIIEGKKIVPNSQNLNGPGGADFIMNQSDMEKEGKATLGDILRKKIKGFVLGGKRLDKYMIYDKAVHIIIDGVNLDFFRPQGETQKIYYDEYLNYLTAEDIKGIEVMTSSRYTGNYFQKFMDPVKQKPFENAFIEITTYSGHGAFLKKTPGVYMYRPPLAFNVPAEFYSPKYQVKSNHYIPDVRSTIYWQPNVITNKDGEAVIRFYTADKPGTYTLMLEGADMNGNVGSARRKMIVK